MTWAWTRRDAAELAQHDEMRELPAERCRQQEPHPGGRRGMAFWPQDSLDYVWVFGGQGFDSTSNTNGYLNDFWTYLGYPKYPNQ